MKEQENPLGEIMHSLQERAKELNCLYRVDELLSQLDRPEDEIMNELAAALPPGWQYPDVCQARIRIEEDKYESDGCEETEWRQQADIEFEQRVIGEVVVCYGEQRPAADEGPFLKEERRLINTIAERIGLYVLQKRLRSDHENWTNAVEKASNASSSEWQVIMAFLRRTDHALLARITRKMINYLCWTGAGDAGDLLREFVSEDVETNIKHWINVFDKQDILSFVAANVFADVEDFEYSTGASALGAHTSYFKRPSFHKRLNERLREHLEP